MSEQLVPVEPAAVPEKAGKPDVPPLTGPQKAALWILSVDEDLASKTLSSLSDDEVRALAEHVRDLGETTPEQLVAVHQEFRERLGKNVLHVRGRTDYLGKLARKAFGGRASRILSQPRSDNEDSAEARLRKVGIEALITVLENEHPQVIAAVVAQLGEERAAEVISRFPEDRRLDVVARLARLKRLSRESLSQAQRVLAEGLAVDEDDSQEIDGVRIAASLLNKMDGDDAEELIEQLMEKMGDLAGEIRQNMFTFEDLAGLDKRGFQALLKEVESDKLLVALKTASEEIKETVFGSLSKRAADMLRDDLEVLGPTRLADIEEAQQSIVAVAMRLKQEGKITISGGGDDFV